MPSSDPWAVLPRHSARCICRRCRDARRRAEFDSWREYGEVERVFSDEAAAHIHQLVRLGWKQTEIARAAGLAPSTVSTAKERGVLIALTTHDAILAVQPGQSRR